PSAVHPIALSSLLMLGMRLPSSAVYTGRSGIQIRVPPTFLMHLSACQNQDTYLPTSNKNDSYEACVEQSFLLRRVPSYDLFVVYITRSLQGRDGPSGQTYLQCSDKV